MAKILSFLFLATLVFVSGFTDDVLGNEFANESDEIKFIEQFFNYINGVQHIHAHQIISMCAKFLSNFLSMASEDERHMLVYRNVNEKLQFLKGILERNDQFELEQNIGETLEDIMQINIDESEWRQFFRSCRITNVIYFEKVRRAGLILRQKFSEEGVRRYDQLFGLLDQIRSSSDDSVVSDDLFKTLEDQRRDICNCGKPIFSNFGVYYRDSETEIDYE